MAEVAVLVMGNPCSHPSFNCVHHGFDQFSKLKFKNGPGGSFFSVSCIYRDFIGIYLLCALLKVHLR